LINEVEYLNHNWAKLTILDIDQKTYGSESKKKKREPLLRLLNTAAILAYRKSTARRILHTTSLARPAFREAALTRLDALVILASARAALAAAVHLPGVAAQAASIDLVVVAAQPVGEAVAGAQQARVRRAAHVAAHVRLGAARRPAQTHVARAARPAAVQAAGVARGVARLAGGAAQRGAGAAHLRRRAAGAGRAGLVGGAAEVDAARRGVGVAAQVEPAREAHLGDAAAAVEDAAAAVLAAVGARLARGLRVVVRVRHARDAAAAHPRQEDRPAHEAAAGVAGGGGGVGRRFAREARAVVEVG